MENGAEGSVGMCRERKASAPGPRKCSALQRVTRAETLRTARRCARNTRCVQPQLHPQRADGTGRRSQPRGARARRCFTTSQGMLCTEPESSSLARRAISVRQASSAPASTEESRLSISAPMRSARSSSGSVNAVRITSSFEAAMASAYTQPKRRETAPSNGEVEGPHAGRGRTENERSSSGGP